MSNPARAPREPTSVQLSMMVTPRHYYAEHEDYKLFAKEAKKPEKVAELLAGKDMQVARSFYVPKEHTVCSAVLRKNGPALGLAKTGVPNIRQSNPWATKVVNRAFIHLPDEALEPLWTRHKVGEAMKNKIMVDAGTEGSLGRLKKAYPGMEVPKQPITVREAMRSLRSSGLYMGSRTRDELRPYPLFPVEGEKGVMVNPNSGNGFPVLGKWSDPLAAKKVQGLTMGLKAEMDRMAPAQIPAWYEELMEKRPWLVALKGKTKGDYYAPDKVMRGEMRFYNEFPRQLMLIMQTATQVLEQNSQSIFDDVSSHSGIGISLTYGGAQKLVDRLQEQLDANGWAFVHVGDDSWVLKKVEDQIVMFALDCSNFDLTQHATVTKTVHRAIADELARVDERAAELWHCFARRRMVVVSGACVMIWDHAGPSGMPLQSKVNDVLMDVMIRRALALLEDATLEGLEEKVAQAVHTAGTDMGFSVKLEQCSVLPAQTVMDAIALRPFLFIGYYFHVKDGRVAVCCDVARTFAQLPFPSAGWQEGKKRIQAMEAMRLGSIVMNFGVPPVCLERAFDAFKTAACELVDEALRDGDVSDPKLRWAVQEQAWGATVEPSLKGLQRVLAERDLFAFWMEPKPVPQPATRPEPESWADEVEEEERATETRYTARPRMGPAPKPTPTRRGDVPTHPPTLANFGRPPPTAVWGPPKAPRVRRDEIVDRIRRNLDQEDERWEDEWEEEEDESDYDSLDAWAERDFE